MLDLLDALGAAARSLAALEDRIAKMEANRARFEAARTALLARLDLDPDTGWEALRSRLRRAQDAARDAERLAQQRTTEERQEAEDRRTLAALEEDRAALAQALGWSEADGPLAAHPRLLPRGGRAAPSGGSPSVGPLRAARTAGDRRSRDAHFPDRETAHRPPAPAERGPRAASPPIWTPGAGSRRSAATMRWPGSPRTARPCWWNCATAPAPISPPASG